MLLMNIFLIIKIVLYLVEMMYRGESAYEMANEAESGAISSASS